MYLFSILLLGDSRCSGGVENNAAGDTDPPVFCRGVGLLVRVVRENGRRVGGEEQVLSLFSTTYLTVAKVISNTNIRGTRTTTEARMVSIASCKMCPSDKGSDTVKVRGTVTTTGSTAGRKGRIGVGFPRKHCSVCPSGTVRERLCISGAMNTSRGGGVGGVNVFLRSVSRIAMSKGGSLFVFRNGVAAFTAVNYRSIRFGGFTISFRIPAIVSVAIRDMRKGATAVCVPRYCGCRITKAAVG